MTAERGAPPMEFRELQRTSAVRARARMSAILDDGRLVEMLRREDRTVAFAVWDGSTWTEQSAIDLPSGSRIVPYSAENNLLEHDVVLLPSAPEPYDDEEELAADVQGFIHRYVDMPQAFEEFCARYVVFTWVYDAFDALPYLRVRGDFGSGKSRFLTVVGSLCYKPIFASGASTVSPIFRILDSVQGTLVIDEGDFRVSDEKAEIVKILNNGSARGFPVLRSEVTPAKEFNPTAFHVFGPKVIATRGPFDDRALESRCITAELGQGSVRKDIPLNLPAEAHDEARALRNKLLMYRFRNRTSRAQDLERFADRSLEPRISQVFAPLLSTIQDEAARDRFRALARTYSDQVRADRGFSIEAELLEVIAALLAAREPLTVRRLAESFADRFGDGSDWRVTPRWVGSILRRRLSIHPARVGGTYVIPASEYPVLERLFERFGVAAPQRPTQE